MRLPLPEGAGRRRLFQSADWGLVLLLALALSGIANYLAYKYHARWDMTASRSFSISAQTKKVLKELKEPVTVVVFLSPGDELFPRVKDLLGAYQQASPQVKVETLDPDRQRDRAQLLAKKYGVTVANVVVFDIGGRSKFVEKDQMVEYDFSGFQMGAGPSIKGFKAEEAFTNALLDLLNPVKPTVYFTSGHGERPAEGADGIASFRARLQQEGMILKEWRTLGQPSVPEDASLVVVAGSQVPFAPPEAELLGAYLDKGGRMLLLLDPVLGEGKVSSLQRTGLEEALGRWGAAPRQDLVVDPKMAVQYVGAQTFFASSYGNHPVVADLAKNKFPVLFTLACSIQEGGAPAGYGVTPLLSTSEEAWGETDMGTLDQVAEGEKDTSGPVVLATAVGAASKEEEAQKRTRIVVVGDADIASDTLLQTGAGNALFLLNSVHWLLSQEQRLAIPPRAEADTRLNLTASQGRFLFVLFVLVLPGLVVAAGVRAYMKRRR